MLVTNDESTWERAWSFKDHGKIRDKSLEKNNGSGFRWLHGEFGTNLRMTEMQAAIGRLQLKKLPEWHGQRCHNAAILNKGLAGVSGLRLPQIPSHIEPGWYKYYAFVRPEALCEGWNRDRIREAIRAEGVPCFSGSCPEIYKEDAFRQVGVTSDFKLPMAEILGQTSLMFMVHPTLKEEELGATIEAVRKVFARATR